MFLNITYIDICFKYQIYINCYLINKMLFYIQDKILSPSYDLRESWIMKNNKESLKKLD